MRAAACGSEAGLTPTPLGARQIAKSDRWAASALVQRLGAAMRARAADPASDEAHNEVQRQVPRPRPHPLLPVGSASSALYASFPPHRHPYRAASPARPGSCPTSSCSRAHSTRRSPACRASASRPSAPRSAQNTPRPPRAARGCRPAPPPPPPVLSGHAASLTPY